MEFLPEFLKQYVVVREFNVERDGKCISILFAFSEHACDEYGRVHGGCLAALTTSLAEYLSRKHIESDEYIIVLSTSISFVKQLSCLEEASLRTCIHRVGRVAVAESIVEDRDGVPACRAYTSFVIEER